VDATRRKARTAVILSLAGIHRVCFFGRDFGVLGLGLSGMGARVASSRRDDVAVALDRASMGAQRRL
jgi:hypothetical protein